MPTTLLPRFRSMLLAASPNLGLIQEIGELSRLYADVTADIEDTPTVTVYQSAAPWMRELLLGVKNAADKFPRLQDDVQAAIHDFETAAMYRSDFDKSAAYVRHSLLKIRGILGEMAREAAGKTKLGYGYDTSGEVQSGGGTNGEGRHLWDTGNSPKHDHTQNNPANMSFDSEAENDYPELAKFKRKRVHWPARTR